MAWTKLGTTTLGSAGDTITVSGFTSNEFIQILTHSPASGADKKLKFNNNGNSVYARRYSDNGASDGTSINHSNIAHSTLLTDELLIGYVVNKSGEEKLLITHIVASNTSGAGNAPARLELVGKFVPSPDADITRVDEINTHTGDLDTDSNLSVLGSDGTEELNVQDGAIYYDTDLNKEYVLYNNTWTEV